LKKIEAMEVILNTIYDVMVRNANISSSQAIRPMYGGGDFRCFPKAETMPAHRHRASASCTMAVYVPAGTALITVQA